jgi:membrane protease YdiL (CAAX protease family)
MTDPQQQQPEPLPAPEPYPFWGYRDVVLLAGLAFVLLIFVGTVARFVYSPPHVNAVQALAVTFAFEGLCFAMLYGVIRGGYGRPFWPSLGWMRPKAGFWKCVGWGVLAAAATIAIGSILPRPHGKIPMEELLRDRGSILLLGFFAVTLGPLFEELAFRGFLMPLLMRTFGPIPGIVLQAVPFSLLHGGEYGWAWQQLVLMFLAGSAFGWMRYKTGSTAASTYMHAGYNFVALAGIFAQSFVK